MIILVIERCWRFKIVSIAIEKVDQAWVYLETSEMGKLPWREQQKRIKTFVFYLWTLRKQEIQACRRITNYKVTTVE